jgi:hypothetical protein
METSGMGGKKGVFISFNHWGIFCRQESSQLTRMENTVKSCIKFSAPNVTETKRRKTTFMFTWTSLIFAYGYSQGSKQSNQKANGSQRIHAVQL